MPTGRQSGLGWPKGISKRETVDANCSGSFVTAPSHETSCGPWSAWSSLNASRSQEAHQKVQDLRDALLPQVALGIALFRHHQIAQNKHFHWEQPRRSQMVNLPHLQEVHERTLAATFDMCRMGDLRDPVSQQPMRKPTIILTTSQRLFDELHGRNCRCTTSHQEIAGSIRYANGTSVLRTKFTARYPRKFVRLVAKVLLRKLFHTVRPYCDLNLAQMYTECLGPSQLMNQHGLGTDAWAFRRSL